MLARRIVLILRLGSSVFLLSSIALVALPDFFIEVLELGSQNDRNLLWAMRMLGLALTGLAAFMLMSAGNFGERALRQAGLLMLSLSVAFTGLTAVAPGPLSLGKVVYLAVGSLFSLAYFWALKGYRSLR